ncbi:regulatory protein YycH of two-component signal transduction system YycFG [Paenibacillus castaneae]|uniref:YycH family regulatory protein n=1 Tax=Paenibacillus castaneae TaxID=474957 RepID=UPI000C9B70BC|nr:two-component system activity regulator YycH [Paenibacillus castaneae]NIK79253.1 regulatory protein YycH of two-component signal transduction system YycFG [Paenibacillus castaneae]
MRERLKTTTLIVLVVLSLLQSYLLAYSMPGLGATVRSDQDYVNAEPMGSAKSVESVIFPEELIIHMGNNQHTVIYPGTQFYEIILNQRIQGREFKGFQRSPANMLNWDEVRKNDIGIELRFDKGIPVELLQKLLKVEGDLLFLNETIDRIWIFKTTGTEEIRTFFFSADGQMVYESVRADLTVRDVQDYVGFGQFQPKYTMMGDELYIPIDPIQSTEIVFPYEIYSPELMQRGLFFDPSTSRAFEDRSGSLIFTDGKRGLQVEQNGMWISYTDPAAPQSLENLLSDNVYASVDFVNNHGGWDGVHRFVNAESGSEGKYIKFKQYVEQYPVIAAAPFRYGYMRLTLQQGVVTEYARSMITLAEQSESRQVRWLPGGEALLEKLRNYSRRSEVTALFPALQALPIDDKRLQFLPVWAVRLTDGTEEMLLEPYPVGYEPPPPVEDEPSKENDAAGAPDSDKAAVGKLENEG